MEPPDFLSKDSCKVFCSSSSWLKRDEVCHLGKSIDEYYGATGIGERDAILLWRASSSLSHGERWFRDLAKGAVADDLESPRFTDIVTHRSLDVVCSGVHIL